MSTQVEEVRLDEVLVKKVDQSSPFLKYIGRADIRTGGAQTSDPIWQIIRVTLSGGVETQEYADYGSYRNVWDSRSSYFSAFTVPTGTQGALVVGTTAVAVRVGASDLPDRKTVTLYNNSQETLYWGWSSGVTTSTGIPIIAGAVQTWCVEGSNNAEVVPTIYVIAATAGNSTRVMEA